MNSSTKVWKIRLIPVNTSTHVNLNKVANNQRLTPNLPAEKIREDRELKAPITNMSSNPRVNGLQKLQT
ncbi:hypothetical protein Fmac_005981 [Flemingia macrophylla]|uniref:Uncharacterized protein n=1 Tax=Flemingia macrophylla TaxID=520843 RepID=A0ABD1N9B2_9FABA